MLSLYKMMMHFLWMIKFNSFIWQTNLRTNSSKVWCAEQHFSLLNTKYHYYAENKQLIKAVVLWHRSAIFIAKFNCATKIAIFHKIFTVFYFLFSRVVHRFSRRKIYFSKCVLCVFLANLHTQSHDNNLASSRIYVLSM